jgi:alkanesulfonate monooxygenase SsuD/methylene tetrahydromethanopterin reductase-like flavin-dependent oxidoreductase (luciferase family)
MKLSLFIGAEHRPTESMAQRLSEHAEQVRLARQLGFDGVSIGNHLSYGSTAFFPPFETLMRLAAEADGMSLGTCMLILPFYNPLHVAEQVALLDAASSGRAILGVAPGWQKDEFQIMGLDYGRRIGRYTEALDLIKRLYTEEDVTFEGKHFRTSKLTLAMRPTRKPRPPLWLGGSVENAVRRAAKIADPLLGDTWVASSHLKNNVITEQAAVFKAGLAEQGKPALSWRQIGERLFAMSARPLPRATGFWAIWACSPASWAMQTPIRNSRTSSQTGSLSVHRKNAPHRSLT